MAHVTSDRVRDTTTTTGTGALTVSGTAPTGYRTFSAVCSTSDTFWYAVQHQSADEWEVGLGTYSALNTVTRTTVIASSNAGAAVNFSAGTKDVFITLAAGKTVQQDSTGAVAISASSSSAALRVTQTGSGNALLIEDSASTDSTPFVVNTDGDAVLGATTAQTFPTGDGANRLPVIQAQGSLYTKSSIAAALYNSAAAGGGGTLSLAKSNSGSLGSHAVVASGDVLGSVFFSGSDGTNFVRGAQIVAAVDGTPGASDMPGRLVFSTTADGASSPTERMRITNAGRVGVGRTPSASSLLDVNGEIFKKGVTITPWINVKTDYAAAGDGTTDDTTAINNAIAAANSSSAVIYFPPGTYKVSGALTAVSGNGVIVQGSGARSTIIAQANATADTLTLSGQFCYVRDMSFQPSVYRTAGYEIKFAASTFGGGVSDVFIQYAYNGIWALSCTSVEINNVDLRYLLGTVGVNYSGTSTEAGSKLVIRDLIGDNPWQNGSITFSQLKGNLANSTAYALHDVVISNGWIWQCTTAGTSAAAASLTVPTTSSSAWTTTSVTTGTAAFRALSSASLAWISQDNYANSLTIDHAALVNGAYGFRMIDTAATGSSWSQWAYCFDLECDHNYYGAVDLQGGAGFNVTQGWFGSTWSGNGVTIGSSYKGEVQIDNSRIMGCGQNGVLLNGGSQIKINNSIIAANSQASSTTYHGVNVAAGVSHFTITANTIGRTLTSSGGQGYPVLIAAGASDFYVVSQNVIDGNATSDTVSDGGTGANKSVTANVG